MAIEIEAKIKVLDHQPIRNRLRDAGAEHLCDVFEINTFFDTPAATLNSAGSGLRLRSATDLRGPRGQGGRTICSLTFKGPLQPGAFKQREELETTVGDIETLSDVLSKLGYQPSLTFEKKRQSWRLGNCRVELDEVAHLGTYVEIEGPDETSINAALRTLDLSDEPLIKPGYASLLAKRLPDAGHRVARF